MKVISVFGFRGSGTEEDLKNDPDLIIDIVAGHMGYSFDGGNTVYGFGPSADNVKPYDLMMNLIKGKTYNGIITDDTAVFETIKNGNRVARDGTQQSVYEIKIHISDDTFDKIKVEHERLAGMPLNHQYGFPCKDNRVYNCVTYLQKLGIPIPDLSGQMAELGSLKNKSIKIWHRTAEEQVKERKENPDIAGYVDGVPLYWSDDLQ